MVRAVTYQKYEGTLKHLEELAPLLRVENIDRAAYQELINAYAETHEHNTCLDFHHQVKPCLLDAVDDGLLKHDPTRRVKIGGTQHVVKHQKFLESEDAKKFMATLNIKDRNINWDHFIFLMINTGLRFAEGLGLTPEDFDFDAMTLRINKSWNYKARPGTVSTRFQPTKNASSVRTISIDLKTAWTLRPLIENAQPGVPIWPTLFGNNDGQVFNSTIIYRIKKHCDEAGVPEISVHGLRHTHASLLIANGVSIQAVAKRLGHANTITTQQTYIHLLKSAEKEADEKIASILVNM